MRKFTLTLLLTLVVSTVISTVTAQELTTALSTNPPTLNPQETFNGFSFAVTNQIYETLFRVTPEGDIAPGLATAWEFIDPTTLEVTLREGVSFHDGTLLSAAAVAASLGRDAGAGSALSAGVGVVAPLPWRGYFFDGARL